MVELAAGSPFCAAVWTRSSPLGSFLKVVDPVAVVLVLTVTHFHLTVEFTDPVAAAGLTLTRRCSFMRQDCPGVNGVTDACADRPATTTEMVANCGAGSAVGLGVAELEGGVLDGGDSGSA